LAPVKVLRDRKKMAEKIQAMSMEAKASRASSAHCRPIVMLLVYLSTPNTSRCCGPIRPVN